MRHKTAATAIDTANAFPKLFFSSACLQQLLLHLEHAAERELSSTDQEGDDARQGKSREERANGNGAESV